jgi:hypothetical protein
MNRTLKDATVGRYYYDSHDQLRQHLDDFISAYNFARRLKTLTQDSEGPHTLRVHLQNLAQRAQTLHP